MNKLFDIVNYLNKYLNINSIKDGSWNGLQYEGKESVKKICIAVDSGVSIFEEAAKVKADMVIVHHGLLWKGNNPSIKGVIKKRLQFLIKNNISLYAVHLPLDIHPVVGNNAELLKVVKAKKSGKFFDDGNFYSYWGRYEKFRKIDTIVKDLCTSLNTECKILPFGNSKIEKVSVLSGAGNRAALESAAIMGHDLFITGEEIDIYQYAKDLGINVIFAGHNATETVGVKALGKNLKKKFKLNIEFIDQPTDL